MDVMISTLLRAYKLKDETRTGWELRGVREPESVADHSWGTALLCLLFAGEAGVGLERCLSIAAVHDLAEAETGDVATRVFPEEQAVSAEEKQVRELGAMKRLAAGLERAATLGRTAPPGTPGISELWKEYEENSTPEAVFVRDMNLIDMCLQALKYEKEKRYLEDSANPNFNNFEGLDEFFATARPRVQTETGRRLFAEIHRLYKEERKK
jgi:putative hydrolase of HD superfamily